MDFGHGSSAGLRRYEEDFADLARQVAARALGFGRIVALYYHSSTLYQIDSENLYLYL